MEFFLIPEKYINLEEREKDDSFHTSDLIVNNDRCDKYARPHGYELH